MLVLFRILSVSSLLWMFCSCGNQGKSDQEKDDSTTLEVNASHLELDNIWVKYKFTANEVNQFPEMIEQSLVDYISVFNRYNSDEIQTSLKSLIKKSAADSSFYSFLHEKFSYYLYHPNSPMRNDSYYEEVLSAYLTTDSGPSTYKEKDKIILALVQKNQVGARATNFRYTDLNGVTHEMHDVVSPYKILVFYDPKCSHCSQVLEEMKSSTILNDALDASKVLVLAIDVMGNVNDWKSNLSKLSTKWNVGIDKSLEIQQGALYNILAYPTIYVLDQNGTVILKDTYFSFVENLLLNN